MAGTMVRVVRTTLPVESTLESHEMAIREVVCDLLSNCMLVDSANTTVTLLPESKQVMYVTTMTFCKVK